MQSSILPTYKRSNLSFIKGKGSYLITKNGKKYLDFVQGIAVNALGHNHEHLVKTMKNQADKPWHLSNLFSKLGVKRRNQATSKARELGLL